MKEILIFFKIFLFKFYFRKLTINSKSENEIKTSKNENFVTKDLIPMSQNKRTLVKNSNGLYSHFILEWIRDWSLCLQEEILLESYILNQGRF